MFSQKKITTSYKNKYEKKVYSLKDKLTFTILMLTLISFLSQVPIIGINRDLISTWLSTDVSSALGVFTMFAGTSFESLSIFALGIAPYITSSIIIQLLRVAIPKLDESCKDGKDGKDRTERLTYVGAVVVAVLQIIPMMINFVKGGLLIENSAFYIGLVSISMFLGSALLIFLGKMIDKRGVGNGISLILLLNIISTMPTDFYNIYAMYIQNSKWAVAFLTILIVLVVIIVTLIAVVYLQEGTKNIPTTFSSRVNGNKNMKANDSSIPLKVNMSGVMPVIFASSLMQIYPLVVALIGVDTNSFAYKFSKFFNQANWFNPSEMIYSLGVILYILLVIAFAYFYQMISFNTKEVASNLAKRGGMIKGVRPGKPTEEFLNKQLKYLLLLGSLMLVVISLIPMVLSGLCSLSLSFGGTSLLIVVSVIIETYNKITSETVSKHSKNFILGR